MDLAVDIIGDVEDLIITDGGTIVKVEYFEILKVLGNELNAPLSDWAPLNLESCQVSESGGYQRQWAVS